MKKLLTGIIILIFNLSYLLSQSYLSWFNYSFSQRVTGIDFSGSIIWITTQGGLVKFNKNTKEKTYYNRANSNLPDNNLLSLFCDSNGDVWLGSKYYGIGKFNEAQCTVYNQSNSGLPSNQFNSKIKKDNNGNTWVASLRWMAKFNGDIWNLWETGSDISPFPIISDFIIDKFGVVWICSTDGFGKIENDAYSIISGMTSGTNSCIEIDKNNEIWIGTEGKGLFHYNGSILTNYNTTNSPLPTNNIYSISYDSNNNIWMATSEGLVKFNKYVANLYSPDNYNKVLLKVEVDSNEIVWCGTYTGALLSFNGSVFNYYDLSNSPLRDNYITDILVDNNNIKWIGTKRNVVKKTDAQFLSEFNRSLSAFVCDNYGSMWFAFSSGDSCLIKIGPNSHLVFNSSNSPFVPNKPIVTKMIIDTNNTLWIASKNGLFSYDGIKFLNYNTSNSSIPSNEVLQIVCDKDNNIWGGTGNGLFKFDGITWTVWNRTNSNIPTNVVVGLALDSENKLWFSCMDENRIIGGDYGGGLTYFDSQTMKTYNTNNSGLLTNTIFDVFIDEKGLIWLGTCGAGLVSFNRKSKWQSYNVTNSGIANNIVQLIKKDKLGNLWLSHVDAGVSVFNPNSFVLDTNEVNDDAKSLRVFPNPASNYLNLIFPKREGETIITNIFDLTGRLIHTFPLQVVYDTNQVFHYQLNYILRYGNLYIVQIVKKSGNLSAKFLYNGN